MTDNNTNNETYEVTFTLRQTGMEGAVQAYVEFSHPPTDFFDKEPPQSFERMVTLVQWYLYETGIIDEDGDLIEKASQDFVLTNRKNLN